MHVGCTWGRGATAVSGGADATSGAAPLSPVGNTFVTSLKQRGVTAVKHFEQLLRSSEEFLWNLIVAGQMKLTMTTVTPTVQLI
jgi:hypothetical protein